jgi:hypothetical protein
MVCPLPLIKRHLDEVSFSFKPKYNQVVEGVQAAGGALDFDSQAGEAKLALRQPDYGFNLP